MLGEVETLALHHNEILPQTVKVVFLAISRRRAITGGTSSKGFSTRVSKS
jgi:hypothetical protein